MSGVEYAGISGTKEYCTYPPKHITEFKYTNQACPLDGPEKQQKAEPVGLPTPLPHGGLYTDARSTGKPWHSIPVMPEMHTMMQNLASANPPPGAMSQFVGTERPGNNNVTLPGVSVYKPDMYSFTLLN